MLLLAGWRWRTLRSFLSRSFLDDPQLSMMARGRFLPALLSGGGLDYVVGDLLKLDEAVIMP
jgi:hypothetical protein